MNVRTRIAPSPTGYLHVGTFRTVLYDYFVARQAGGQFLLRIEDTDQEREVPGAVVALLRAFERMGIDYDEGPVLNADGSIGEKGSFGPYVQSKRLPIYKEHAETLLAAGHAYYCFCSKERLDEVHKQQEAAKIPFRYDRTCLNLPSEEVSRRLSAGESHVIRLKIPEGQTTVADAVRGLITFPNADIDDQILMKSDGFPTYHLAAVVDDHLMEITHVIRGEEWLPSTPKHVILYAAFGWNPPVFAHLPVIVNPDRTKLSKRQGDVAVEDYLTKGYLPEALINFLSLIGYNPKGDQEIYTREELVRLFDLSKVNSGNGLFDTDKLDWMNGEYIKAKTTDELMRLTQPFLQAASKEVGDELLKRICAIEKTRMVRLTEIVDIVDAYLALPAYDSAILVWKKADAADARAQLSGVRAFLENLEPNAWTEIALIDAAVKEYIGEKGLQNGNVLWPTRVALSGRSASPSPFELAWALGKTETLIRLQTAIESLPA